MISTNCHKITITFFIVASCCDIFHGCLETDNASVWGPGLQPHEIILPARYIFIDLKRVYNETVSPEAPQFSVDGKSLDGKRQCRIWPNLLDRKDGTFILRYKLYEPCSELAISIKYKDKHIAKSPYHFKNIIYNENCYCPNGDINEWLRRAQCGKVPESIKADLKIFGKIKWNKMRNEVINKYDNPGAISMCHYVIKNNSVHRKCYGKYVGFNMFSDSIFLSLARQMRLPDMEFFMNLGDWPLIKDANTVYPMFSWCGSTDSFDIVLPTYDITQSSLENMGRVMLDMLSVQGNNAVHWDNKTAKAFWRGRDSNKNRLKLIDLSRNHSELFNVSLTNFFNYRHLKEKYGPAAPHVSFYKFFDYKYQVNIDGTVAAYRFPYLLAGGSLIFKQNSKYYEHYYRDLEPMKHYVPVQEDLSDLVEKLEWAIEHDEDARRIAAEAVKFANDNLLPEHVFCYHAFLLNEYSQLLQDDVEVLDGMELIEQNEEAKSCRCSSATLKDEL